MPGQSPTETLDSLLHAWRETKDPRLAERIARYGAASESAAASELRSKPKLSHADWLAALREGEAIDRGAVLARLATGTSGQVAERIAALAELDGDPRVVDALHALIEAVPWTSTSARKVWTATFRLLIALADPRTIEFARRFDAGRIQVWSESAGPWMAERLTKVADTLAELPPPPRTPEIEAEIEALIAKLGTSLEPVSAGPDPVAALLTAAMAAVDDLDARLVLADALSDRGDPRGELIRVQIARETAPTNRELAAREKQLLTDHRDSLLGTLGPIARKSGLEFERGFVRACTLEPLIHTHLLEAALADERVATLRKLRAPLAFVVGPQLTNLREVSVIPNYEESMRPLLRADRALPFVSLDCRLHTGDDALLDGCTCLPALDRLGLSGNATDLVRAGTRELARRVAHLHFQHSRVGDLAGLFALVPERSRGTLSVANAESGIDDWHVQLAVTRDGATLAATLTLTLASETMRGLLARAFEYTGALLAAIQGLPITSLEVCSTKAIRKDTTLHQLQAIVAQQVSNLDPVWSV